MQSLDHQGSKMINITTDPHSKITQRAILALTLLLAAPVLCAQSTTSAPRPPLLTAAKSIFISNASEAVGTASDAYYSQFTAAVQNLSHFTIVTSPDKADLIVQIGVRDAMIYTDRSTTGGFYDTLRLVDPKSHVILWSVSELSSYSIFQATRDKNAQDAINHLATDLLRICTPPAPTTN